MPIVPEAKRRWDGRYELRFPFNQHLVDMLKVYIDASDREWNPQRKVWIIDPTSIAMALDLLKSVYPNTRVVEHEEFAPPRSEPIRQTGPHATLYVLPDAPRCVVDAAYRALAREFHPDRAPAEQRDQAHEVMLAINEAYEVLRDRVAS
jgi:hypothetical protein